MAHISGTHTDQLNVGDNAFQPMFFMFVNCTVNEATVRSYSQALFSWQPLGVTLIKQDTFCQYSYVFCLIRLTWLLHQVAMKLPIYGFAH